MDDAGNSRDDLTLPKGTDDAEKLARQIQEEFEAGKELTLTVLKVRKLDLPQLGSLLFGGGAREAGLFREGKGDRYCCVCRQWERK